MTADDICSAIRGIRRMVAAQSEYELHATIEEALRVAGISYQHEVKLGPRCRIDFLVASAGVGIEVKKGRVGSGAIEAQAARYLAFPAINELIVVVERTVYTAPQEIGGKRLTVISLNALNGVAL